MDPRELLLGSFAAAVAAADPLKIVPAHLPKPPRGRTLVVGAGKAAGSMALAVEERWPANAPLEGVVITRYGHGLPTKRIRVVEAGHPVPDEHGEAAARAILAAAAALGPDDLLLALVSGGGSALLSLPVESVTMAELKALTRELLASGAPIQDMNTVRKHLSLIQGGRLALATRARVLALVISDVTGDDPTHIASGPCAPDPSTFVEARSILERFGVRAPASIAAHLEAGAAGRIAETPKPGAPALAHAENRVIATAQASLMAAAAYVERQAVTPLVLGDSVTGESSEVAKVMAAVARQVRQHSHPFAPPVAIISGGETTVTLRGQGRGGRCSEFLLSLAVETAGEGVWALACDTDGIDGSEDNAGAILSPDAVGRAHAKGIDPKRLLADNDGYGFFSALGDLVVTGPTRTNVNDYRVILVR
jgi:hydroxypyruvate reductase